MTTQLSDCGRLGASITDRLQISRQTAYLVDSTAAPVATLALISTWVGYEVSLMDEAMKTLSPEVLANAGLTDVSAYALFLEGLPYRFPHPRTGIWLYIGGECS